MRINALLITVSVATGLCSSKARLAGAGFWLSHVDVSPQSHYRAVLHLPSDYFTEHSLYHSHKAVPRPGAMEIFSLHRTLSASNSLWLVQCARVRM